MSKVPPDRLAEIFSLRYLKNMKRLALGFWMLSALSIGCELGLVWTSRGSWLGILFGVIAMVWFFNYRVWHKDWIRYSIAVKIKEADPGVWKNN